MYIAVKYVHVISVVLSLAGFFLRGILMLRDSSLLRMRWVRVLPHINDTVLLIAALSLAAMTHQYPFVVDWVTAKVFGVIGLYHPRAPWPCARRVPGRCALPAGWHR